MTAQSGMHVALFSLITSVTSQAANAASQAQQHVATLQAELDKQDSKLQQLHMAEVSPLETTLWT